LTLPYITEEAIKGFFGDNAEKILSGYFVKLPDKDNYSFKEEFNSEMKINKITTAPNGVDLAYMKKTFTDLVLNVVLIPDCDDPNHFYPSFHMRDTTSFASLPDSMKKDLSDLYDDYFFNRQESLWEKIGLERLPILKSSDMLVCVEDLGMVPRCVEPVLHKLQMLSLKVQRWESDFDITKYPYLSVATPSTHDVAMSREWWEEDREAAETYWKKILKGEGPAPKYCEPWICKKIMEQQMKSSSMWAIFFIQELFSLIDDLRVPNPKDERINDPNHSLDYWIYRIPKNIEELLDHKQFCEETRQLVEDGGRK